MKKISLLMIICTIILCSGCSNKPAIDDVDSNISTKNWDSYTLIGHALSGVGEDSYTNSLEAFYEGYNKGLRVFEVDLQVTSDNKVVLIHDFDGEEFGYIPTEEQFLKTKIKNKYTSLSFVNLLNLMVEYPDIYIVTDSKYTDKENITKEFNLMIKEIKELDLEYLLDRFVIQIYNYDMYDIIKDIYDFKNIIFTLYAIGWNGTLEHYEEMCKWSYEHNIKNITMFHNWFNDDMNKIIKKYNLNLYLHTVNDATLAKEYLSKGVKGIYTDYLEETKIK